MAKVYSTYGYANNNQNAVSDNEKSKLARESLQKMDTTRTDGLQDADTLQAANANTRSKEQDRLAKKYGKDHPRVVSGQSKLQYQAQMKPGLQYEIDRSKVQFDEFDSNTWRFHGRVLDANGKTLPDVCVFFTDVEHRFIEVLGNECSNEHGYVKFDFNTDQIGIASERQQVFLAATIDKKKFYYLPEPLTPVVGQQVYRDIVLEEAYCAPPFEGQNNDTGYTGNLTHNNKSAAPTKNTKKK